MTDELVTRVHEKAKEIVKEKGYLYAPTWWDTQIILAAAISVLLDEIRGVKECK